ncbi:MAG: hypothetical protein SOW06_08055 [Succinivibrionaceae bacterium]|nr:hypothetical protein [Pseudomonadota bacterium]MDY3145305.1 hypothetical protein [Succinivibrionaceae bacterium]
MYEINIADKKMLREMVQGSMEKGGLDQSEIMSDLSEEMELRWEYQHPGQDSLEQDIRIKAEKELYSLVMSPEKPTPLLDQLTDLKMLRRRESNDPDTMKEFIKTYGPNAGLEAGAETDPAEA